MNKYIIEFLGTFFLVIIIGLSQNPVAIGLGLAVLVYMGAHISGAHYNPVVSLAMLINNQIELKEFSFYLASQLLGSVVATSQKKGSNFSLPKEKISIVIMIIHIKATEKITMFHYLEELSFILLL